MNLFLAGIALFTAMGLAAEPVSLDDLVRRYPGQTADGQHQWVADPAQILGADLPLIRRVQDALRADAQAEMVLLVLPQTESLPVKELAVKFFEAWKPGRAGKDNGVLVLHAVDQRRVEVEVGYGLEGDLPDIWVSRALSRFAVPSLKENRPGLAHLSLALAIRAKIANPRLNDDQVANWVEQGRRELAVSTVAALTAVPPPVVDKAAEETGAASAPAKDAGFFGWIFVFVILGGFAWLVIRSNRCKKCKKGKLAQVSRTPEGEGKFRLVYRCGNCGAEETRWQTPAAKGSKSSSDRDEDSRSGRSGGAGAGSSY